MVGLIITLYIVPIILTAAVLYLRWYKEREFEDTIEEFITYVNKEINMDFLYFVPGINWIVFIIIFFNTIFVLFKDVRIK